MQIGDGVLDPPNLNQEVYVNVVRFLRYCATNGLCTIIASYYGSGGTGEDFHDEANPAGDGAFICAEWNAGTGQTFYVLVRWGEASWTGSGLLMLNSSSLDGVGIMMAVRDDGTNPWNGTSNDDGADTIGTPVWNDGGSTVRVFPRSNATGGTHATNKNNMIPILDVGATNGIGRCHFVANENELIFVGDNNNDGLYIYTVALGRYTPRTGLEGLLTTPYFMASSNSDSGAFALGSSFPHGGTVGSAGRNGGICALPVNDVMDLTLSVPNAGQVSTFYQPNKLISPNEFEPTPYSVLAHESGKTAGSNGTGDFGLAGYLDIEIVSAIYNSTMNQTNADGSLAWVGHTTIATRKWALSWDAGASPHTNMTRLGRQSFQA
jgi:hypothetical protein